MGFTRWQIVTARDVMLAWRRTLATVVAVERFRAENRRAIAAQFECERWSDAYQRARLPQLARASLVAALTAGALFVRLRSRPGALWAVAWSVVVAGVFALLYAALAGGLDASSINQRAFFVRNALASGLGALVLGAVAHAGLLRRRIDHVTCSETLVLVALHATDIPLYDSRVNVAGWVLLAGLRCYRQPAPPAGA
jgi:hypothetical protein